MPIMRNLCQVRRTRDDVGKNVDNVAAASLMFYNYQLVCKLHCATTCGKSTTGIDHRNLISPFSCVPKHRNPSEAPNSNAISREIDRGGIPRPAIRWASTATTRVNTVSLRSPRLSAHCAPMVPADPRESPQTSSAGPADIMPCVAHLTRTRNRVFCLCGRIWHFP
jgi:hypothetical protein